MFRSTTLALLGLQLLGACADAGQSAPENNTDNVASATKIATKTVPAADAPSAAPEAMPDRAAAHAVQAGDDDIDLVARGAELVTLGGCGDCHTPMRFNKQLGMPVPDLTLRLSGHPEGAPLPLGQPGAGDQGVIGATFTSFRLPFGVVFAANLTPDAETGLGSWSEDDFIKTMRTGHKRGTGRPLLPPMPWQNLSQQPEANLKAIFAYLQSLPPIKNRVPTPDVPAPVIEGIAKSYAAAAAQLAHK